MLFKEIYELAGIRTSSHSGRRTFATQLNAKGVGMRTIQKLMGHRHHSSVLRGIRRRYAERRGAGVIGFEACCHVDVGFTPDTGSIAAAHQLT